MDSVVGFPDADVAKLLSKAALKRNISKLQARVFRIAIRVRAVNPSANVLPAASRHPD